MGQIHRVKVPHGNDLEGQQVFLPLFPTVSLIPLPIKRFSNGITGKPIITVLKEIEIVTEVVTATSYGIPFWYY